MGENADDNDDSDDNNADEDGNYEGLQDAAAVMMIGDDVSDNVVMVGWHRQHPASTGILCWRNRHRNLNPELPEQQRSLPKGASRSEGAATGGFFGLSTWILRGISFTTT